MQVTFVLNTLLSKGLTADDFTILMLLQENKLLTLKKYEKLIKDKFTQHLIKLKKLDYLDYNEPIVFENIKTTSKFLELISGEDLFEQLYNSYPVIAIRPDGKKDSLRSNRAKCKLKYLKLVKNNKILHDHILDCLEYEKDLKHKTGYTGYYLRLYNYLEKEEWKKYENNLKVKIPEDDNPLINSKTSYGANFL